MKVSVVIPCHNEELSIGQVVKSAGDGIYEIIVVDNNCTDNTVNIAKQVGARVVVEPRLGYGRAIQTGFENAQGDVIAVLDGDGQYPSEKILEVVNILEKTNLDFISCSRFPLSDKKAMVLIRKIGNHFFNFVVRVLFGIKLKDSQSGMWVFRAGVLKDISLESSDMSFSEEIKIKAVSSGLKFKEVPITYNSRNADSCSKLSPFIHGFSNLFYLVKLSSQIHTGKLNRMKKYIFSIGVFFSVAIYVILSLWKIKEPFLYSGLDVNVGNSFAAINWLKYGPGALMYGNYPAPLSDPNLAFGHFYTHHPSYYLFFPYLFFKIFGISEWSARASIFLPMALSLPFFAYALKKFFKSDLFAVLTVLILSILPGMIFYGSMLELTMFSLPASVITYSIFLIYSDTGRKKYLYYFFVSILFGGLMGWIYFFMPFSIWLFVLSRKNKDVSRNKLLFGIPLALIAASVITLTNFYIINGNIFADLFSAFEYRSAHVNLFVWFARVFYFSSLHFTWVFLSVSLMGVVLFYRCRRTVEYTERYVFLLPLIFSPLFLITIFSQWFTHQFGPIFLSIPIAIFSAFYIINIYNKFNFVGLIMALVILSAGGFLSWNHLQFYYTKFRLIGDRDVALLSELRNTLADNELCVDPKVNDDVGLIDSNAGAVGWYYGKSSLQYPDCLSGNQNQKIKVILLSKITTEILNKDQLDNLEKIGLKKRYQADWWYLWSK